MLIKTHFFRAFGFRGFLELDFLFTEEIWQDLQEGFGYILSSIFSQKLAVSTANTDMVDL